MMTLDDAISRQAMLDAINRIGLRKCSTNEIQAVDECLRAVEALPPVTPSRHKGRWIKHKVNAFGGGYSNDYECSECGYMDGFEDNKFCPNCGAEMVEPQESEDK